MVRGRNATLFTRARPAVLALTIAFSLGAPLAAAVQPKPGARVAAIFPPMTERDEALARVWSAGGVAVAFGAFGSVVIAESDDDGFVGALRDSGAWAVIDGELASALCGAS